VAGRLHKSAPFVVHDFAVRDRPLSARSSIGCPFKGAARQYILRSGFEKPLPVARKRLFNGFTNIE
jgi:hypothetical protein